VPIFWQRVATPACRHCREPASHFHFVRGDSNTPDRSWVSAVLPEMIVRIAGARLTTLGGTGHMMILEAPLTCRGLVLDEIAGAT
jgi:hypothetical protein